MSALTERLIVGPFNRVEGDLEVRLDIESGQVMAARVCAPMYRGFEQMLVGRDPLDALVYVPRICGICSVSQSVAAASALANLAGLEIPANGRRAINLMVAAENLADHLSHFYLFFMPDFTRPVYQGREWYQSIARRFSAQAGPAITQALAARSRFLELLGTLGGKWPHTLAIQPGGSSRAIERSERLKLLSVLAEFREFLETMFYGCALESIAALDSRAALEHYAQSHPEADFAAFARIAGDLSLDLLGRGPGRFLTFGAYPQADTHALPAGLWEAGRCLPVPHERISEDASHSWLEHDRARHPSEGRTEPSERADGYTWNKAPRLAGKVIETGAIARQLNAGQPLISAMVVADGGSVFSRVLARAMEPAIVLPLMQTWLREIEPGEPYCANPADPARAWRHGDGAGLSEAARGALGHWVQIRDHRITRYQIIAPTSWNFSPRDLTGVPGALEQALVGAPVAKGESVPVAVQHIVRSFDPCMVCTVH